MPKKSKPKRTNWKQRALHCEEVIGVQNELARVREANLELEIRRAENAEKRVQELEGVNAKCETCDSPLSPEIGRIRRFCHNDKCAPTTFPPSAPIVFECGHVHPTSQDAPCEAGLLKPPTHWQRFKSWWSR